MKWLGLDASFPRRKSARRSAEPVVVCLLLLFGLASVCAAANGTELRVNVYLDQRRNDAQVKRVEADVWSPAYGYRQLPARDGTVVIEPSSKTLMELWKGDAELTDDSGDLLFEYPLQFLPVMLVVDVTNPSAARLEISRAYLRVAESLTDRQPLVRLASNRGCGGAGPSIGFTNDGWRTAENAVLDFSFGPKASTVGRFRAELGSIGNVAFEPERALMSLMPGLSTLRAKPPRCDYNELDNCLRRWAQSGHLGPLAGRLRFVGGDSIGVDVSGTLTFQWKHHPSNELRQQRRSFRTVVSAFRVDLTNGPECGGGGPGEGGFDAVPLRTDASHYEVPLPYRGPLDARGNRRFELTLKPGRASTHRFEAVVETSDGRVGVSPPVSLLYFVPTTTRSPLREVR